MAYQFAYLNLTLTHSKCQGQVQAHFDCEYRDEGDRWANIAIAVRYEVQYFMRLIMIALFTVDLGIR